MKIVLKIGESIWLTQEYPPKLVEVKNAKQLGLRPLNWPSVLKRNY